MQLRGNTRSFEDILSLHALWTHGECFTQYVMATASNMVSTLIRRSHSA